jgi:SAM-dependent methyltransferase
MLSANTSVDSNVLEIGCGPKQYRPYVRGRYRSLDLPTAPSAIEPPDYICGAEAIPVKDDEFDLVFGVAVFLFIKDVDRAFSECRRVLKPGGQLLLFDYPAHVAQRNNDADRDGIVRRLWNYGALRSKLETVGFTNVIDRSDIVDRYDRPSWKGRAVKIAKAIFGVPSRRYWLVVSAQK